MCSYASIGQRPQALALYHQFAGQLYQEMSIVPVSETEALYRELLRQDESDRDEGWWRLPSLRKPLFVPHKPDTYWLK